MKPVSPVRFRMLTPVIPGIHQSIYTYGCIIVLSYSSIVLFYHNVLSYCSIILFYHIELLYFLALLFDFPVQVAELLDPDIGADFFGTVHGPDHVESSGSVVSP